MIYIDKIHIDTPFKKLAEVSLSVNAIFPGDFHKSPEIFRFSLRDRSTTGEDIATTGGTGFNELSTACFNFFNFTEG
jgi:hypothetical protein